jgi:hypothetical protein
MIAKRSDPWLSATLLVVSVATLGRALQVGDGILKEGTIPWLAIAFAACLAGTLLPAPRGRASYGRLELIAALVAVLLCQIGQMLARAPFNEILETGAWYDNFRVGVIGAGFFACSAILARGWMRATAFALLLVTYVVLGASVIRAAPEPFIDVHMFQRDACEALANGVNPYSITFPAIYGDDAPWYGEGVINDGRLQFGYPYMPLTILMALPGHLFGGDYRYAQLISMTLSAALMVAAKPGPVSVAAAALLLFQPRGFYIMERGWNEPMVLLTLCATIFCAVRFPRALPWMLGLFLASKQYIPLTIGATILLSGEHFSARAWIGMLAKALLAAIVVTLPLALWDWGAFWHSAVELQVRQPYRWDSLSFLAWWMDGSRSIPRMVWVVPFVLLVAATFAVLWRVRHTAAGFAAGVAVILFSFLVFNKQAFGNYYLVVIGAMCCAIATTPAEA